LIIRWPAAPGQARSSHLFTPRGHVMTVKNKEPYQQSYYPPVPTGFTRYMRTSIVWQFIRFWIINFKIFKLLMKSHH
jgi:hypothetical protein